MKTKRSCIKIQKEMFPYVKGELSFEDQAVVDAHLKSCTACRIELDEMPGVLDLLTKHHPSLKSPEMSWDRIQSRVRLSRHAFVKRTRAWILISLSAIIVFGGICLFWLLHLNDQVVGAINNLAAVLGWNLAWLTEGPISSWIAPLLFIGLCSIMTLVLSPFLLKKANQVKQEAMALKQDEALG